MGLVSGLQNQHINCSVLWPGLSSQSSWEEAFCPLAQGVGISYSDQTDLMEKKSLKAYFGKEA